MVPTAPVTIANANISGWPQAITMTTPLVSLTIAPEAARILGYSFIPGDTNYLWTDLALRGRTFRAEAPDRDTFHNFGGLRFDVAPQSAWTNTSWGRQWPPPPVMNTGRTMERQDDGSVRLDSYQDTEFMSLLLSAVIGIVPRSSLVRITQVIRNLSGNQQTWSNWIIAQIAARVGESRVYVPPAFSMFNDGYMVLMPYLEGRRPITGDFGGEAATMIYTGDEGKIGFDDRRWIAIRPYSEDTTVLALQGAGGAAADHGTSVQMYTGNASGGNAYVELERTGPLTPLQSGEDRRDEFLFGAAKCMGGVTQVSPVGITCAPLELRDGRLRGSFGVFYDGIAKVIYTSRGGFHNLLWQENVSPLGPFAFDIQVNQQQVTDGKISVQIFDSAMQPVGELAAVDIEN